MAILINGRSAVHKDSKGTVTTIDPCYTGPQRQVVNYQNVAKSSDAANTAKTVFINGNPVCHKNSYFEKSYGSEAGDGGGVKSGTNCGKAEFVTASSNVFIEGIPAVRQGDKMVSNNRNTEPAPLMQPGVPFKGDQEKINQFPKLPYPKLEFDLSELPIFETTQLILMPPEIIYIANVKLAIIGNIVLEKEGLCNRLTLNLNNYEVEAKEQLGSFTQTIKVISYNEQKASIGSEATGEFWTSDVTIQFQRLEAKAIPQPLKKIYKDWIFTGLLGFELTVEYEPVTSKILSLMQLIPFHSPQIIGMGIASPIIIQSIRALVATILS